MPTDTGSTLALLEHRQRSTCLHHRYKLPWPGMHLAAIKHFHTLAHLLCENHARRERQIIQAHFSAKVQVRDVNLYIGRDTAAEALALYPPPDQVYKAALLYARGYILSKDLRTQCYLSSKDDCKWEVASSSNSKGE